MNIASKQLGIVWKNPYITDGLIAMWDGEWNVGKDVHDGKSLQWIDIIGERKLVPYFSSTVLKAPEWGDKFMLCNGAAAEWRGEGFDDLYQILETSCTIEFAYNYSAVAKDGGQGANFFLTTPSRIAAFDPANNTTAQGMVVEYRFNKWGSGVNQPGAYLPQKRMQQEVYGLHTATMIGRGAKKDFSVYIDGAHVVTKACDASYARTWNGLRMRSASTTVGRQHCLRVYDRLLSTEEIAMNCEVDRKRFT